MSHQNVECPGCLTKLRVKESQSVIRLACPRCGEQLVIDPPEPTRGPQPPAQKRPVPPSLAAQRPNPVATRKPQQSFWQKYGLLSAQEGGAGASQPLMKLAQIAIVDSKREEVLRVMKNQMSNSNGFVRKSAIEVFCSWATAEQLPELRKILEDPDGLMLDARKRAFQTIAKVGTAADFPALIGLVTDGFLRNDVKTYLFGIGPAIEDPILKKIDSIKNVDARNELNEVLEKVGTKKSIDKLEEYVKSRISKHNATHALDAIRARQ